MGRQAARREHRDRRARPRLHARAAPDGRPAQRSAGTARRCGCFAAMRNLDVWYARMDFDAAPGPHGADVGASTARARRAAAKARKKDSPRALARLTEIVDGRLRIISAPPLIERVDDLLPGRRARLRSACRRSLTATPPASRTTCAGCLVVPLRRHGAQGRRRGQRRHAGVDHPARGPGRRRSPRAAGQGGRGRRCSRRTSARALREPRRARRPGPAADAGGERHPARLGPHDRHRRPAARLLRAAAVGRQGVRGRRDHAARRLRGTASCAAGPSPALTHGPATGSRSPPTSARATRSTGRWRTSPSSTRSRTTPTYSALEQAVSDGRLSAEAG